MAQTVLIIDDLPDNALEAASVFHAEWAGKVRNAAKSQSVAVVLPDAPYDHRDWRNAAVRDLARAGSPRRVNFVSSAREDMAREALSFLERAAGVTGQYLQLARTS